MKSEAVERPEKPEFTNGSCSLALLSRRPPDAARRGLCSDCVERLGCTFSNSHRTIWECEEYCSETN